MCVCAFSEIRNLLVCICVRVQRELREPEYAPGCCVLSGFSFEICQSSYFEIAQGRKKKRAESHKM